MIEPVIVYEDEDIMVVNKPHGMAAQPSYEQRTSVLDFFKKNGQHYLELIHRLDQPVGGLMILAKNDYANQKLSDQVRQHLMKKSYLAVVEGDVLPSEGKLEHYLQKIKGPKAIVVSSKVPQAKLSRLAYKKLNTKILDERIYSLIEVELETGRFHQIRAQLSAQGFPIVKDTKYNATYVTNGNSSGIPLFAYALTFNHPRTQTELCFKVIPSHELFQMFDLERF